jgi:hypothetical protein
VFCGTAARARRPAFWNAVISINNFLYYFFNIYIYPRALRALRALPGSPGSRLRSLRALPGSPGLSARSFYPGLSIFVIAVPRAPAIFAQLLGGRGPLGLPGGPNRPKMGCFAGLSGTRSRQDASKEVHAVGSKRPSSGSNGGHVRWWIGLICALLSR